MVEIPHIAWAFIGGIVFLAMNGFIVVHTLRVDE